MLYNMNESDLTLKLGKIREDIENYVKEIEENEIAVYELKNLRMFDKINKFCDIPLTIQKFNMDSIISKNIIEKLKKEVKLIEAMLTNENIIL